jgi:hypothetical protein
MMLWSDPLEQPSSPAGDDGGVAHGLQLEGEGKPGAAERRS